MGFSEKSSRSRPDRGIVRKRTLLTLPVELTTEIIEEVLCNALHSIVSLHRDLNRQIVTSPPSLDIEAVSIMASVCSDFRRITKGIMKVLFGVSEDVPK